MNVLDENFPEDQRVLLHSKRVAVRQIGREIGQKGMQDDEIIPLLHQLGGPTFFTLDQDFYSARLCHDRHCLVHLDIDEENAAAYVRRILRYSKLNTKAKRMGKVIRVTATGLSFWRVHEEKEVNLSW